MATQRLTIELTPASAPHVDVRRQAGRAVWAHIARTALRRAHGACGVCGAGERADELTCHPVYHYDLDAQVGRLDEIIALCPACLQVKHVGRAFIHGHYREARAHLARVNGWTTERAERYVRESFRTWEQRSEHAWTFDVSMLEQMCARAAAEMQTAEVPRVEYHAQHVEAQHVEADEIHPASDSPAVVEAAGTVLTEQSNEGILPVRAEQPAAEQPDPPHETASRETLSALKTLGEGMAAAQTAAPQAANQAANQAQPDADSQREAGGKGKAGFTAAGFMAPEDVGPETIERVMAQEGLEGIVSQEQLDLLAAGWAHARTLQTRIARRRKELAPVAGRLRELKEHLARAGRLDAQLQMYFSQLFASEGHAAHQQFQAVARESGIRQAAGQLRQEPGQFGRLARGLRRLRRWLRLRRRPTPGCTPSAETAHLAAATAEALWHRLRRVRRLVVGTGGDEGNEASEDGSGDGELSRCARYAERLGKRCSEEMRQLRSDEEELRAFAPVSEYKQADEFLTILEPERWGQAKARAGPQPAEPARTPPQALRSTGNQTTSQEATPQEGVRGPPHQRR